jgi:sulfotransferase family protein
VGLAGGVNPYVFIVGCTRSGTTLLRRIVDAHPDIAITRETHWITKLLEGDGGFSPDAPVTPELLARLRGNRKFTRMGVDQSELDRLVAREEPVSYAELVTRIFDLYGEGQGKRLVGDKVPTYVRDVPLLHRLWPQARFVHLIRDGRDVSSSLLSWGRDERLAKLFAATWERDRLSSTALYWDQLVRLGREAGARLGPDLYYELRYEALVADPDEECSKLCAFLGVPLDERMLRFHEGHARDDPGLSAKKAWRPITPGLRSWRTEMNRDELERFEAAAGDLLDDLGYPRAVPDLNSRAKQEAAELRDLYGRHALARGTRLPERWGP